MAACTVGACALLERRARQRPRRVDFRWSAYVDAPVERAFALWRYFQASPRFLNAPITQLVRGKTIAWATKPGGAVRHAGVVTFAPERKGTRVDVTLTYGIAAVREAPEWLVRGGARRTLRTELDSLGAVIEGRPSVDASSRRHEPRA